MAVTQTLRSGAWRVVELITTPLVPADYLDVVAPLRNKSILRARVEAVRPETRDSVTLGLRRGRRRTAVAGVLGDLCPRSALGDRQRGQGRRGQQPPDPQRQARDDRAPG